MNINDVIGGFKVVNKRSFDELKGTAVEMLHEKSGARLLWLDRNDVNKTFSISFRTVPSDDTGIFHILEHSVLCGSKKYPVKEPFVELIKNSMNTFLNALTFSDKTMYPISSKNDKDFFNLMDVYLDAVFNPAIYTVPEIFYQEGWHYEFDENGNVSYKGVVFNEMKGVYADADSVKEIELCRRLFPDTCYGCESGGYPASIPTLSYEQFINGHKKYYHPSNSYIILDGALDIEKVCEHIGSEYLSKFNRIEPCKMPDWQSPVINEGDTVYFEQSKDMPLENQSSVVRGFALGKFDEKEKIYAANIIASVLAKNNQSYLTKALMAEGLCEDVSVRVVDGIYQPYVVLDVKNVDGKKADEIAKKTDALLSKLCDEGINKKELEAAISNLEFQIKEKDFGYPRGLYYAMTSLETWLYDGDAVANVITGDVFDVLRSKAKDGYFEKLIFEIFLNNNHRASVVMMPSYTVGDDERAAEQERIDTAVSKWSEEEKQLYKDRQKKLLEWQSSVDSPEDLAKIPMISVSDIDVEPEHIPFEFNDGIIKHNIQTDGIVYADMFFDITGVSVDDLPRIALLTSLLGELDTEKHSARELKTELLSKCGGLNFNVLPVCFYNSPDSGVIKLQVSFACLNRYFDDMLSLVREIITSTSFDNTDAVSDIVKQTSRYLYQSIVSYGSLIAKQRALMSASFDMVCLENTTGYSYYKWLKEQEKTPIDFTSLSDWCKKIFGFDNLIFSIANDNADLLENGAKEFVSSLGSSDISHNLKIKPTEKKNDAIIIPGDIAFSGMGAKLDNAYSGVSCLACHIATYDYLWNEVRVKGGAYGCGVRVNTNGTFGANSFRDPNAAQSVKTFLGMGEYLTELSKSDKSLSGFIIGAMSSQNPLLTPKSAADVSNLNYLRKITEEQRRQIRCDIVNATKQDIADFAEKLADASKDAPFCIIGSENQVKKAESELDEIYSL